MKAKRLIRVIVFFALFVALFLLLRCIMLPKWNYPNFADNVSFSVSTFYGQEECVDDVVFLGTSHATYAISPMEIYKEYGLVSYNLGTSLQGILESYALIRKVLAEQNPRVVVLDVSSLFFSYPTYGNGVAWEYLKTSLPSIRDTAELILDHSIEENPEKKVRYLLTSDFWDQVLSMDYIGSRWKDLTYTDFRDTFFRSDYYSAGYFLCPVCAASQGAETMNKLAEEFADDTVSRLYKYENYVYYDKEETNPLYDPKIADENARILRDISELCKEAGSELLLVKYPVINNPITYPSAWTKIKSEKMKEFSENNDYEFLDLLYDADINIDYAHDFVDGGVHLNYYGARKVSLFLGKYLKDHYNLLEGQYNVFDANMKMYDTLTELAEIMLETDLPRYISKLRERTDDVIICMAASDDISVELNDQVIDAMRSLGLQLDYRNILGISDSFVSLIDGEEVLYEGISNRRLVYDKDVSDQMHIAITSSGLNTGARASIVVNGAEYACDNVGLNIVVIDKKTGMVIDSVVFDANEGDYTCHHRDSLGLLDNYWLELMRNEGKII